MVKSYGIALIDHQLYVLTVLEKCGKWGLPKGKMENVDNTKEDTIKRELYEETNIDLDKHKYKFICNTQNSGANFKVVQLQSRIDSSIERENREIMKIKWVHINELIRDNKANKEKFNRSITALTNVWKTIFAKMMFENRLKILSFEMDQVESNIRSKNLD